jgi:hypothetical protein
MGWEIEYKNFERFLNNHSEHWPLKKFKILQRLNSLKESKLENGLESYEAIVLGDEEFVPMALNVSIMIHVGEVEELKKQYNRLSSQYEATNDYLPMHHHEDSFCSIPLREQNSYSDLRGFKFTENEYFDTLESSINRVTESFVQVSFRYMYSEKYKNEFQKIVTDYKSIEYQIVDITVHDLLKRRTGQIIANNNSNLTQNGISKFLEKSRWHALEILGKKLTDLHIGPMDSVFSLFVFGFKVESNEGEMRNDSFSRQLYLYLGRKSPHRYTDSEGKVELHYEVGEYRRLDTNSEMLFFNRAAFSEADIVMHGGEFSYLIMNMLRIYIECGITTHFSIITLLLHYYSLLTKYRYTRFAKYTRRSLQRYSRFLRETHYFRAFIDEYSHDENEMENHFKCSVYELSANYGKDSLKPLYITIYRRVTARLAAIHALEKQITSIVNVHKDHAIVKSTRRLSVLMIILAIVAIVTQCPVFEKLLTN